VKDETRTGESRTNDSPEQKVNPRREKSSLSFEERGGVR